VRTAPYGAGAGVTGGIRVISCAGRHVDAVQHARIQRQEAGSSPLLNLSRTALDGNLAPRQHEHHEQQVRQPRDEDFLPGCFFGASVASLSPSSRMIVGGFQNFSTSTIAEMQASELRCR
jgi:hypothetical protein